MLSVRVAAALARTLPKRAGFVSILIKQYASDGNIPGNVFNIYVDLVGVKDNVDAAGR